MPITSKNSSNFFLGDVQFQIAREQSSGGKWIIFGWNMFQIIGKFIFFAVSVISILVIIIVSATSSIVVIPAAMVMIATTSSSS